MAIQVQNLTKTYRGGQVRALDDVSLEIETGEVFGIIGPNGAGKTTFLGCLLGFLRPDRGTVSIDGHAPDDVEIRSRTGYLPERLVLDRWMSGRDFLAYHHALARLPVATRAADVESAFARVGLDRDAGVRPIRKYSRGMLQRLGLAQSLLGSPRYVFLDEPASGVDPAGVVLFRRLLLEQKSAGATILLNSHQLEQVERVCDRVAFVSGGRVEAVETLRAGAELARVLRVRSLPGALEGRSSEALAAIAVAAGAELLDVSAQGARFAVTDDAAAARLVERLVQERVPVIEVAPEESRLERLFLESRPSATGTPAADS